jgi:hypothetical protein
MFTQGFLKIFHYDDGDAIFTKFAYLHHTGSMDADKHKWEVLATQVSGLGNELVLKMYILGLEPNIRSALKPWRPKITTEARSTTKMIERKLLN